MKVEDFRRSYIEDLRADINRHIRVNNLDIVSIALIYECEEFIALVAVKEREDK